MLSACFLPLVFWSSSSPVAQEVGKPMSGLLVMTRTRISLLLLMGKLGALMEWVERLGSR